jgi:hypothetical protein
MQITLLSFFFKKFNIIKKGINIKDMVCWANKASRAIFASQSGNIGLY